MDVKNVVRTLFWAGGEWNVVCGKLLNGRGVEWAQEGHGLNELLEATPSQSTVGVEQLSIRHKHGEDH